MAARKTASSSQAVIDLPLTLIDAGDDTFRQRAVMDVASLVAELRLGPQQVPVFVRRRPDGRHQIIAGFRRVHALKELGRDTVRAIVADVDDAEAWRIAWAENAAHLKPRGVDLVYLVFKLHAEGRNHEEVAHLCGMNERDKARVASVGVLEPALRATVIRLGLSLRFAALVATFHQRHPNVDVTPTLEEAAAHGLNEASFARRLAKLGEPRGRKQLGIRWAAKGRVVVDIERADPTTWSKATRKRVQTLIRWLEDAVASAGKARGG